MTLSEKLKDILSEAGAKLVGYGSIRGIEGTDGYTVGIAVALPVPAYILQEIADGPTKTYYVCTVNGTSGSIGL